MILWPAAVALVVVWLVFRDPAIDHRMVLAGALLPDLVDGLAGRGRAAVLHSVGASVVLLGGVMLATRGRRATRRRWLFLPVGAFLHLVADGMWARTHAFWWPAFGWSFPDRLPALDHGLAVLALEEVAGALVLVWWWRRFHLGDPATRTRFLRTGRLPRDVAA